MNPNYNDFRFPQIKAHPWHKVYNFISFRQLVFQMIKNVINMKNIPGHSNTSKFYVDIPQKDASRSY